MICANENFDNCPLCLYYKVKIHESAMQLLQEIQGYHNHKKKKIKSLENIRSW